jgi:hypothetical protein
MTEPTYLWSKKLNGGYVSRICIDFALGVQGNADVGSWRVRMPGPVYALRADETHLVWSENERDFAAVAALHERRVTEMRADTEGTLELLLEDELLRAPAHMEFESWYAEVDGDGWVQSLPLGRLLIDSGDGKCEIR